MCPPAYIITIRVDAIANGASVPAVPSKAAVQIVRDRNSVPMNSVVSLARVLKLLISHRIGS